MSAAGAGLSHCRTAHATHPDAVLALRLAAASLQAQWPAGVQPTLGVCYLTDSFAPQADALWAALSALWPGVTWVGGASVGVLCDDAEYIDEPGLVLWLSDLPRSAWQVFHGTAPLRTNARFQPHCALVHADPHTPDLPELLPELAQRTASGYLFGGLTASRSRSVQLADGLWQGGLSGVAFAADVGLVSRITQGCQPVAPVRRITEADDNVVLTLDGEPALDVLLRDLQIDLQRPGSAMPVLRATLVGLTDADDTALQRSGQFGPQVRVRHLLGLDVARRGVVLSERAATGSQATLCQRNAEAAARDLTGMATALRAQAEEQGLRVQAAHYVSCAGRGGPHFGAPHAEAQRLRRALGDVPTVGFFAGGEIAHDQLYGYSGVLTVFTHPA